MLNSWQLAIVTLIILTLAIFVVVNFFQTAKPGKYKTKRQPPPLPPKGRSACQTEQVDQTPDGTVEQPIFQPLPPRRRTSLQATAVPVLPGRRRALVANIGPRGVLPTQFPCCPYDKQRNVDGAPQLIFWDSEGDCYRCSRGHRFKRNGRVF